MKKDQITCTCDTYRFPHRAGSGLCNSLAEEGIPTCRDCGGQEIQYEGPEPGNYMQAAMVCNACGGGNIATSLSEWSREWTIYDRAAAIQDEEDARGDWKYHNRREFD